MRKLLAIMVVFVIGLLSLSLVSALEPTQLAFETIRINGDDIALNGAEVLSVEEGQPITIRMGLTSVDGATDVEVEAKISGYEYSDYDSLTDSSETFDLVAGRTTYKTLELNIPRELDDDVYRLRLRALDRNGVAQEVFVTLGVEPVRHGVEVVDVSFSPGNSVKAGRSLLATVLLENFGSNAEDDVKVTVAIPSLGVSAVEFVDVDASPDDVDYEDVPEMFLPVPATAAEGDYDVVVSAEYDRYETSSKTFTVHVQANEQFQPQDEDTLVLAVGPESQNVAAGKTATYAVALTNAGSRSKAFVLEPVTGSWATATVSDSMVVLEPGKNQVVYVEVTPAADATAGEHAVSLNVKSGNEVLETVTLSANVVQVQGAPAASDVSLRNGLEIALIVLVVLLVIIGLIVGFSRLRKDNDGEDKTYY